MGCCSFQQRDTSKIRTGKRGVRIVTEPKQLSRAIAHILPRCSCSSLLHEDLPPAGLATHVGEVDADISRGQKHDLVMQIDAVHQDETAMARVVIPMTLMSTGR